MSGLTAFEQALATFADDDLLFVIIHDSRTVPKVEVPREYALKVSDWRARSPEPPPPGPVERIVNSDGLRVRSAPRLDGAVVGYLNKGAKVMIDREQSVNGALWAHISSGTWADKWLAREYLT